MAGLLLVWAPVMDDMVIVETLLRCTVAQCHGAGDDADEQIRASEEGMKSHFLPVEVHRRHAPGVSSHFTWRILGIVRLELRIRSWLGKYGIPRNKIYIVRLH